MIRQRLLQVAIGASVLMIVVWANNKINDKIISRYTHPSDELVAPWTRFFPSGFGCSVEMPPSPTEKKQTISQHGLTADLQMYTSHDATTAFSIGSFLYPSFAVERWNPDELLQASRDNAVMIKGEASLRSERQFSHQGHPGIELIFENTVQGRLNVTSIHAFIIGRRAIQLVASGTEPFLDEAKTERFFTSLRID